MAESRGGATRLWAGVGAGIVVILVVLGLGLFRGGGTPPPPQNPDGSIDSTKVCTAVEYDTKHGDSAAVALVDGDTVRGEIVPEEHSHRIKADDLRGLGRVIARVRLLGAGIYPPFGLRDTIRACWFVRGDYPDSLVSTIYGFDGRVLAAGLPTYGKHGLFVWHPFHAEAHWERVKEPGKKERATLDLRPAELRADAPDSARRRKAYARVLQEIIALGQGSCTTGGCCKPRRMPVAVGAATEGE